ncbi:hypothetical protein [Gallaecimonas pentaromativorans]|uniref:hypothetical protein n=1 Tax=Gallaecimonas pentaromativorans TaxID=584787 RepID=UPI003A95958C
MTAILRSPKALALSPPAIFFLQRAPELNDFETRFLFNSGPNKESTFVKSDLTFGTME